jgi:hypothetical protein
MSSIKQRTKNKSIRLKCSREVWKDMLAQGRESHVCIIVDINNPTQYCWQIKECYWSKPKHV